MFNLGDLDDTISVDDLEKIADCAGVDIEIRAAYSGRGMYGKACPAVVFGADEYSYSSSDSLLAFAAAAGMMFADGGIDLMRDARSDSMGRGTVIYWPGVEWAEGGAPETDEDDEDDDDDENED